MSGRAQALERAWSRLEAAGPNDPSLYQSILAERVNAPVAAELLLAAGLHREASTVPPPDFDAEWARLVLQLEAHTQPMGTMKSRRPKLWARIALTAAVAGGTLTGLSVSAAGAAPGSLLYPLRKVIEQAALFVSPRDAGVRLEIARARLDDLVGALDHGDYRLAPGLSRDLVESRRAAVRSGAGVKALDREIDIRVPKALAGAPATTASAVRDIFGSLLPPVSAIPPYVRPPSSEGSSSANEPSTGPSRSRSSDNEGGPGSISDSDEQDTASDGQQDQQSSDAGDQQESESGANASGGGSSNGDDESSGGSSGDNDPQGNDPHGGGNDQGDGGGGGDGGPDWMIR